MPNVLCFTWSVGPTTPIERELEHWLPSQGGDFDIIAVGTQEHTFKAAANPEVEIMEEDEDEELALRDYLPRESMSSWEAMIIERLNNERWVLCKSIAMKESAALPREMRLSIFVRREHLQAVPSIISDVQATKGSTDGAAVGAKGGLVISLNFNASRLAFVSCHLAPKAHNVGLRNANCAAIVRETRRMVGMPELDVVSEFDHLFWMGNLNYHLDPGLLQQAAAPASQPTVLGTAGAILLRPPVQSKRARDTYETDEHKGVVNRLITDGAWDQLLEMDQLRWSQAQGEAFVEMQEGPINWPPTFPVCTPRVQTCP